MFSKAFGAALEGIDSVVVQIEADISDGLPSFDLVGLLASEVKEAKERVRVAIKNSNFILPPKRMTINLSPADIRKEGTAFDLPIAVAILTASGYLSQEDIKDTLFIGELSLNGKVNRVNGVLPIVHSAKKQGFLRCMVPKDNVFEGAVIRDIEVIGVESLIEISDHFMNKKVLFPTRLNAYPIIQNVNNTDRNRLDFCEVVGQAAAKRAIEVAAAGQHNILMLGSPGSGKTMLAKRIPTILPELSFEESLDLSKIYSVSGSLPADQAFICKRPFRAPHHTITNTALIGGGRVPKPGEVSLAAYGVLFLDELPEFKRSAIEALRQPIEDAAVTVTRMNASYTYPANFMLVAAINPCPCGYYPNRNQCRCSDYEIKQYLNKISRPLLDRIDICIETSPVKISDLTKIQVGESSESIRQRIEIAREIQYDRYSDCGIYFNSQLSPKLIKLYCSLSSEEEKILNKAFEKMKLTARAYHRILKVARTIADLDEEKNIELRHLSEAICYKGLDRKYWGY